METIIKPLEKRIIEAVIANGGLAEDIQYLSEDTFMRDLGLNLAQAGLKNRTPNPAFLVMPLNNIYENFENFASRDIDFTNFEFKFKTKIKDGLKIIELKKYSGGKREIMKQIDTDGFVSAPLPYLLGLGVQYPALIKGYDIIFSLDKKNLLVDDRNSSCRIVLQQGRHLGLTSLDDSRRYHDQWFAVIRKEPLVP